MPHLTQKGQVTIPGPIRRRLNLKKGDDLTFAIENGKVVVRKRKPGKEAFRMFVGCLGHMRGKDSDQVVKELRGDFNDLGR